MSSNVNAQSAKRFYADAKTAEGNNNIEEAIDYYSKAITVDSKYYEAYLERAKCQEKLGRFGNAVGDYRIAMSLKIDDVEPLQLAAKALIRQNNYADAYVMFKKITDLKKKNYEAMQQAAFCLLNMKDFNKAIAECNKAIEIERSSPTSYLYKAMAYDSLAENKLAFDTYSLAVSYLEKDDAFKKDLDKAKYYNYYLSLGNAQLNNNFIDFSIGSFNHALEMKPNAYDVFALRGKAYASKMKMEDALNDYNKSIVANDKYFASFCGRAYVFFRLSDFDMALSDYEKAIVLNSNSALAYKGKGQCQEAKNKIADAEKSYSTALELAKKSKEKDLKTYEDLLKNIQQKSFESQRETDAPVLTFTNGDNAKMQVVIPKNKMNVMMEGRVTDKNKITKILIADNDAKYNEEEFNPTFSISVNVLMKDEIEVYAQDVYGNELKTYYKVMRTEKDAPKSSIAKPIVDANNTINLADSAGYKLTLSGKIEDESFIKSLVINGKTASYNSKEYNPTFLINLDIVGVDSIKIVAIDEFDNTSTISYTLKRAGGNNADANPMGKTWVVFIDNAKYSQLPMLEASSNDVLSMKSALESYNIANVIVKNDMTKAQMEKFFSIELRDLVNENIVNSVMIFYAGHGKFINENGYWLPVDANKKDEFTFFNVSSLKNYLSNYKPLTHSLVVSDACETGPAFYLAMRDANKIPECGQWESARKKSAQVLTSTTIDLNDDKSVFTKSFVAALKSCNDKCISIEKIADKIGKQTVQAQKPKPKLGIIPTLNNDDDATFFFVKK